MVQHSESILLCTWINAKFLFETIFQRERYIDIEIIAFPSPVLTFDTHMRYFLIGMFFLIK